MGAQAMSSIKIDVQKLNCDFLAFSGHKMYSVTGVGVLFIKKENLYEINTYQEGGGMLIKTNFKETIYSSIPQKLEAGTIPIASTIALGKSIDFINNIDR